MMVETEKGFDKPLPTPEFATRRGVAEADESVLSSENMPRVPMNADYWEERTALIRDGAVRMLTLSGFEEVDYWRDELKSNRRNSREMS
jgi:hypothetical protein